MTVAVAVLSRSTEKCARDYLLDVLLDASVYDEIKEEIVFQLALAQYDKSAGIVLSNFFRKIQFMSLDFSEEDRAGLFVEAYARAFTKLLISGEARVRRFGGNDAPSVLRTAAERAARRGEGRLRAGRGDRVDERKKEQGNQRNGAAVRRGLRGAESVAFFNQRGGRK